MADLLAAGPNTLIDLAAAAASATNISSSSPASPVAPPVSHVLAETDLLAPLPRPGKVVAIGRNYREHADEEGVDPPPAPLVFAKWPSSVVGPGADIRWDPALTEQVDYEAELAVVIGRTARNVSVDEALDHVFGYTCLDDVSARDIQFGDGQWVRGKSLDTFCPMGPWLVTADEIPDPQALAISCRVNDEVLQDSNTSRMYFGVAEIISYLLAVVHARTRRRHRDRHARRGRRLPRSAAVPRRWRRRHRRDRADRPAREHVPARGWSGGRNTGTNVGGDDDGGPMTNERFFVTGALGCVGAWTVRELVREGTPVVAFDLGTNTRRLEQILTADEIGRITFVTGDITDLSALERVLDDQRITNVIHLAALQVPFSRADPPLGAAVNVVGTVNVFEAVRRLGLRDAPLVYASSMGMFIPTDVDPVSGRLEEDAVAHPGNHYGVYKLANEGNARIYWADSGVASVGLRPMTVYGVGRDQGMTSSPTVAIAAAVLGSRSRSASAARRSSSTRRTWRRRCSSRAAPRRTGRGSRTSAATRCRSGTGSPGSRPRCRRRRG